MRIVSVLIATLLASSAALAQPGPMMGGQGQMADGMPMGMMMGGCAMMGRSEGALAFLKTELQIKASQEKAWSAFADAYRKDATERPMGPGPHHGGMKGSGMGRGKMGAGMMGGSGEPFPKVMEQHIQMMQSHLDRANTMNSAAKPLYDALNAEQRKTADELLPRFVMMHCAMGAGTP